MVCPCLAAAMLAVYLGVPASAQSLPSTPVPVSPPSAPAPGPIAPPLLLPPSAVAPGPVTPISPPPIHAPPTDAGVLIHCLTTTTCSILRQRRRACSAPVEVDIARPHPDEPRDRQRLFRRRQLRRDWLPNAKLDWTVARGRVGLSPGGGLRRVRDLGIATSTRKRKADLPNYDLFADNPEWPTQDAPVDECV